MFKFIPLMVNKERWKLLPAIYIVQLLWVSLPTAVYADSMFSVTPVRCVTLREGQPCFVRLQINWQLDQAQAACLYGVEPEPLQCWNVTESESIVLPLRLTGTSEFVLRASDGMSLGGAVVTVSWVYKKKRSRRRWRLF